MRGIVMGGLLTLAAAAAQAHAPLPDQNWCSAGQAVPVARFAFSAAQVQAYADCLRTGACAEAGSNANAVARGGSSGCDVQHCGQFDDDYGAARRLANSRCSAYARPWQAGHVADWGTVVEVVSTPASYNGASHHTDYRAAEGLVGQCARCEDATAHPPVPAD